MSWLRFHPLTRITIVIAVVLGAALFTGVERVGGALASIAPGGAFEERCSRLPHGGVHVGLQPFKVVENHAMPFEALTRFSDAVPTMHRTIGLTRANFGHRSSIEVKGLEDRTGVRACVRPRVEVELFLRPMTVYVAREYATDECRARTIREHEQRHVDVYATYAREAVSRLSTRLNGVLGNAPHFSSTIGEAQRALDRRIETVLESFMRESEATLNQRQAEVDSPHEYQRIARACTTAPGP